tara:strand:- start:106 stop:537 length:432 start_codon:yes stop_codon:yes gene_type:complete
MSNTIHGEWFAAGNQLKKRYYTCNMKWNQPVDDSNHSEIISPAFNWTIDSDFTVFVNYKAVDTSTSHDVVFHVYGSIDTTNKVDMMTAITVANANFDGKIYKYFYDVSTNGIAPYMYVALDPAGDIGATDIAVSVFPNYRNPN